MDMIWKSLIIEADPLYLARLNYIQPVILKWYKSTLNKADKIIHNKLELLLYYVKYNL